MATSEQRTGPTYTNPCASIRCRRRICWRRFEERSVQCSRTHGLFQERTLQGGIAGANGEARRAMRTSSTLSAPSIAFRTRSFSSLVSNRPALPASLSAASTPGSNVLVPDETSEGAAAADPDAAASRNEVCRAVGSPVAVRKSELACSRSWGGIC